MAKPRGCPDCSVELKRIRLLDATAVSVTLERRGLVELAYAEMNAPGKMLVSAAEARPIAAFMCSECA